MKAVKTLKANATLSAGAIVFTMFAVPTSAWAVARQVPVTATTITAGHTSPRGNPYRRW